MRLLPLATLLLCLVIAGTALAKSGEERKKELDFEGDVVEGINKQPLDSISQISDQDEGRKKVHIYRRTKDFKDDNKELFRELVESF